MIRSSSFAPARRKIGQEYRCRRKGKKKQRVVRLRAQVHHRPTPVRFWKLRARKEKKNRPRCMPYYALFSVESRLRARARVVRILNARNETLIRLTTLARGLSNRANVRPSICDVRIKFGRRDANRPITRMDGGHRRNVLSPFYSSLVG